VILPPLVFPDSSLARGPSHLPHLGVKSERFVKLLGNAVTDTEGPEGYGFQFLVLELLREDELLRENLQRFVNIRHLDQDVAHVAESAKTVVVLFRGLGQSYLKMLN
jgi:hypothetical protein